MTSRPLTADDWARPTTLGLWIAALVGAIAGLTALGHGPLAAPPLHQLRPWLDDRSADDAVGSLLRLVALGLAWYLLASTALAFGARLLRWPALVHATDLVTPRSVRRLVAGAAGLTLSIAALSPSVGAAPNSPPTVESAPVMRWIAPSTGQVSIPPPAPPEAPAVGTVQPPRPSAWTVHPGDNLWAIASDVLAGSLGRQPTNSEIASYWRPLVTRNLARLVRQADPDFILPGQVFDLLPPG